MPEDTVNPDELAQKNQKARENISTELVTTERTYIKNMISLYAERENIIAAVNGTKEFSDAEKKAVQTMLQEAEKIHRTHFELQLEFENLQAGIQSNDPTKVTNAINQIAILTNVSETQHANYVKAYHESPYGQIQKSDKVKEAIEKIDKKLKNDQIPHGLDIKMSAPFQRYVKYKNLTEEMLKKTDDHSSAINPQIKTLSERYKDAVAKINSAQGPVTTSPGPGRSHISAQINKAIAENAEDKKPTKPGVR